MVYQAESAKWKAYQFSDPFAAGSFFVCNKLNRFFCRPDCDARPRTNLKSEIKFTNTANEAVQYGFIPCESCDPMHSTAIDVGLLIKCVSSVNTKIGFMPPLLDENEDLNSKRIKENIMESKRVNEVQILKTIGGEHALGSSRRASMPAAGPTFNGGKGVKDAEYTSLSKNDSDHYRLVDLACRHLALAAAVNVFQPKPLAPTPEESNSPAANGSSSNGGSKKRRRRGGVLGFKELAAKSKLSAWHFHRVFKSVTGLTPKTYGDKCWEFVKKVKESGEYTSFEAYNSPQSQSPKSTTPNSPMVMSLQQHQPKEAKQPVSKKVKLEPSLESSLSPSSSPALFTTQSVADEKKLAVQSITPPQSASITGQFPHHLHNHQQQMQPITPPNQYTSPSVSQINTVQSVIPDAFYSGNHQHQPSLDDQLQALPNLDFDLYEGGDLQQQQSLHMKAFSFPDLSKFRTESLFSNNNNNNNNNIGHQHHYSTNSANPSLFQSNENSDSTTAVAAALQTGSLDLGFEEDAGAVGAVDFSDYINNTATTQGNYSNQLQAPLPSSSTASSTHIPSQSLDSIALPEDGEFDFTDAFTQDVFTQPTSATDSTFSPFDTTAISAPGTGLTFNDELDFTMNPQLVSSIID
ncbi:hypothetical protein CANMA_004880 [Candida margitis]|uniref:uncharacterized protein n=1 Tax=Candida margitis TaxID=1775924 RepID=UPI002227DF26|nr:uncharacterized protein CANMA_004880 [Candida margitis]KAI5954041.1 hypothetical protein CANMA_004880 [Candida margitis]